MRTVLVCVLALSGLLPSAALAAEGPWTIAEIAGPAGTTRVHPRAISNTNVVVGTAQFAGDTRDMPFVWKDGVMTKLPLPAGVPLSGGPVEQAVASDVNDRGDIVGWVNTKYNNYENSIAVRWHGGVPTTLPCCFTGFENPIVYGSAAAGINADGSIAGGAQRKFSNVWTIGPGVLAGGGGAWSAVGNPEGSDRGVFAMKINDAGAVMVKEGLGPDRAVVFGNGGGRTVVEIEPGFQGFNDLGHVAGKSPFVSGHQQQARLWDGSGYQELGAGTPSSASVANGVNNSDWAVGNVASVWAYLWRPGIAATNLNSLLDPASGWGVDNATDINDAGVVVGTGQRGFSGEIGFIASPAGRGYQLTGRVADTAGNPVAGVTVRVQAPDGQEYHPIGPVVSGADGKYTWTLPRGRWVATAMPSGTYAVAPGNECLRVSGADCTVVMDRNRTAGFTGGSVQPPKDTTPPQTTITKHPKAKITTKHSTVKVSFSFKSSEPQSTFKCKLDKSAFKSCGSPKSYKVKPGKHTFQVYPTDKAGNRDKTPAKFAFKVTRKK